MRYRFFDTEDDEESAVMPSKFEVCWRCRGRGVHDCWEGGMTGDEMAEQSPDFLEDYLSGVYDTTCTVCRGQRVLEVVDEKRLPPFTLARYRESEKQRRAMEAEEEHERRMGY
jgi:hypothetical protein